MRILFTILIVCGLSGCGTTKLNANASGVKIMKQDPPENCQDLGPLNSFQGAFRTPGTDLDVRNRIQNRAADLGANYFRMETKVGSNISGTAFKCPTKQ